MARDTVEVKAEGTTKSEFDDGGSGRMKIIAGVIVAVVIIAILAYVYTRDGDNGDNGNNGDDNLPPTAGFTYNPDAPFAGQTVTFDGTSSVDPDDDVLEYSWDFGDQYADSSNPNTASGVTASHIYTRQGNYTVELTVDDSHNTPNVKTRLINVTEEETPTGTLTITRISDPIANLEWTITVDSIDGTPAQLALNNIRINVYNGADTNDTKISELTSSLSEISKNPLNPSNPDGIYFDDLDGNGLLSVGDFYSIAGDGAASVEDGDGLQLIYEINSDDITDAESLPA